MLHYATIKPGTLGLLKKIMAVPELKDFNLAGGTSLALQIGHRVSVDLDLFGKRPFERQEILDLVEKVGEAREIQHSKNIFILKIDEVKVDFVNYKYPLLREIRHEAGLRLMSLEDIGAMKIGAIAGRGRKRDFTDLFFLLKKYSMAELMSFYNEKYPDGNEMMAVRSLSYFADADEDDDLALFKKADWPTVKRTIEKEIQKIYR